MPRTILVTNDDGISSPGLEALAGALREVGEVWVVAPDRPRNAVGHGLTLHRPLRVRQTAPRRFAVDGTPVDCVNLALTRVLPERPCLVASGINLGANLGPDVYYSGTVSAAAEAALLGIPAFAISTEANGAPELGPAAEFAQRVARAILQHGLPPQALLNVNVPLRPRGTWRITHQAPRNGSEEAHEGVDPWGVPFYWLGGRSRRLLETEGSDYQAFLRGEISITPLSVDRTHRGLLQDLRAWSF